jgi:hypothetical protein
MKSGEVDSTSGIQTFGKKQQMKKIFSIKNLLGFSAILIAGCAAFFSVTGLGLLFRSISVMIMASSLELAKIVTASYLKQMWYDIEKTLKIYLVIAVAILMFLTSMGIFGFLSDAFQNQSIKLDQMERKISVVNNKIAINNKEVERYTIQINNLTQIRNSQESNYSKLVDKESSTGRISGMIKNADAQISAISKKVDSLNTLNVQLYQSVDDIKNENVDLEKEVGGFRFVADAFNIELKKAVKYFIILIVFVFDPLAVALILAFNSTKKKVESTPEAIPEPEPEPESQPEPDPEPIQEPSPEPQPEPEIQPQVEAKPEPEPEPEITENLPENTENVEATEQPEPDVKQPDILPLEKVQYTVEKRGRPAKYSKDYVQKLYQLDKFQNYSQNGEDGIIQHILSEIGKDNFIVELGCLDGYKLSNSRNLIEKGFKSILIDTDNVETDNQEVKKHQLIKENVNAILKTYQCPDTFDVLSIDLDGNDFWILDEILTQFSPRLIVSEFNACLPKNLSITIKYDPDFVWKKDSYFGFSFAAGKKLAAKHGYTVVYQNDNINMYMIKNEYLKNVTVPEVHYSQADYFKKSDRNDWIEIY